MSDFRGLGWVALACAVLLTAACSQYRLDTYHHIAVAQTTLNGALSVGAADHAAEHVADAQRWLQLANEQLGADRFEDARRSADEAKSLAELAAAKARVVGIGLERDLLQREIARLEQSSL